MNYVLGVDAGNTKTITLVADVSGTIISAGRSGCGDIYGVPDKYEAIANVRRAVEQALEKINDSLSHACYCMAGADWEDDYSFLREQLSQFQIGQFQSAPMSLYNDGLGALRAGSATGYGVAMTIGTYVATAARSEHGFWHSSFWQSTCNSGARQLANDVLLALYRAELEMTRATSLTKPVLELYGLANVEKLLYNQTSLHAKAINMYEGKLVRVLLNEAQKKDEIALGILQHHARMLTDMAVVTVKKVRLEPPFTLVLSGGVLKHSSPVFRNEISRCFQSHYPNTKIIHSQREPVVGALLFALEAVNALSEDTLMRLEASLPPPTFFET
jgi:N-acetylglucosamine kinase-like BadF-type ATPase